MSTGHSDGTDKSAVQGIPSTMDPLQAFALLRATHARTDPADWPTRARRLCALDTLIRDNRDAIAAAISADFGHRPTEETELLEIFPSIAGIRHALRHGRTWMRARRRWAGLNFLPARTELLPQPLGIVGIIVPWNYPLYLAAGPLTDALVAGNRVLVKMSEFTPRFSALFAELVARHFPVDVVAVVNGDADIARAFSALPFDHLLFTGSTTVGREVMRAAAQNLTPVTLELGGKSPAIIGPGARFDHAVERILLGKLVNAGQTCVAPDFVLLPESDIQRFVDAARATVARFFPDIANNRQFASIASDRHHARLSKLRDDAIAAGATAHALADVSPTVHARILAPVLLSGVNDDMAVMEEEIFGPILPLVGYASIDDALTYVAEHPHPLALYVFDEDRATVDRVLARSRAGGVTVNDTLLHFAQHNLPTGGVGASGMGAYHGESGFRTFSHIKPIFRQARWNAVGLLNPPYRGLFRRVLKMLLG